MEIASFSNNPIRTGFLLVDPLNIAVDSFPKPCPPMLRCTPSALANADDATPRLIDVAALPEEEQARLPPLLEYEMSGARPPVICAWLETVANAEVVSRHIGRYLVGTGQDGRTCLWRYYDPRVFALATSVLTGKQLDALLGPVRTWHFPWLTHWWTVHGTGQEADPLEGTAPAWPTREQWAILELSETVISIMLSLQDKFPMPTTDRITSFHRQAVRALLEGQSRFRLTDPHDLADYTLKTICYGDGLRHHAKLVTAWDRLAQGSITWTAMRDLLDETDYASLDRESKFLHRHFGAKL